jgi:hypothetical protein
MYADDAIVTSGSAIDKFAPAIGANVNLFAGAAKATRAVVGNRTAAVFAPGAVGSYTTDNTACKSVIALAQWLGAIPFDREVILTYLGAYESVLFPVGGSVFNSSGAKYINGTAGNAVTNSPICYTATGATAAINSYLGGINLATQTFDGPVWFWARFVTELSAGQVAAIYAALKNYYSFLP